MSKQHAKSQAEQAKAKGAPFTESMEQMMGSCGPQMKKWMAACASNMSEECRSCCGTESTTETTEKK
jgi:hypothetical protein